MISAHSTTRPLLLHFTNKPLLKKTMKSLIIVLLTVVGALGTRLRSRDLDEEWKAWMDFHGKEYNNMAEEMERRLIWEDNLRTITKHNLEHSRGEKTYRLGMNAFGDMTNAEFVATRTMKMNKGPSKVRHGSTFLPSEYLQLPDAVDWRTKGYVTPVKDQGQCGSCWAFSTVGALEGQHFAKTGNLVSLSEQNLVDCAQAEGDMGCEGGWPSWADEYIKKNGGIDTEAGYPYTGEDGTCHFSTSDIGATLTGFVEITTDSEKSLEKALAQIGPISVCIDASQESFQLYESGVYNEPDCSSTLLDHCVTAVGYDVTSDGDKYYIVKNSWGTTWGQEGYIWMSRDNHNQCGIATNATYPLV